MDLYELQQHERSELIKEASMHGNELSEETVELVEALDEVN